MRATHLPILIALAAGTAAAQTSPSWSAVENALGRKGTMQPGGVMRFSFPRRDLHVTVGNVEVRTALALGSWVAFKRLPDGQAMVMGDLVLANDEIDAVISALQSGGVGQSALHNHILGGTPNTMYLHISAHGREADIARTVRRALESTHTPMDTATTPPPSFDLDSAAVAAALGYHGRVNGGVYQVSVPRAERIMEGGNEVPASMGISTSIGFQPTGAGRAAITGDFVMIGSEVGAVIRALREAGISVTALHSHLIGETPRLYFMHFWADDDAVKLAKGLHAALAKTNSQRPAAQRGAGR